MEIKNGKKPLSSKKQVRPAPVGLEDIFGNVLGLDPALIKELDAKNLSYRFISLPELHKFGGYHRYGWKPYKRSSDTIDNQDFKNGTDPDGMIRRGELVLATRPKELNEKHKAYLKQEAEAAKAIQKRKAGEIRDLLGSNSGIEVHEGYEDEGEEVTD